MFAVMYEINNEKFFKIFKTQDDATVKANNMAALGYKVTVFDYDSDNDEYLEFYTI